MLEMLLYSRPGHIELLPALPTAWAAPGSLSGAGARGAFTVDMAWGRGRIRRATLHSVRGSTTTVTARGRSTNVTLDPGGSLELTELAG
ncbi:glycoside hydrolase family 95-like protein [Streptomyces sp. NPDC096538]|uniref:glycoside hydrolase family 95-like protein n=1 Tax=Streptomyces sp. NPDC096538 TaxID=3155427 RepID=UPI00332ADB7A